MAMVRLRDDIAIFNNACGSSHLDYADFHYFDAVYYCLFL
jgi:hypothetical protein